MSTKYISLPSPAKLNLFLHVTGRLANGYHSLQTLFQLLEYGDTIHLQHLTDGAVQLETPLAGIADTQHLAVRAAKKLQSRYCVRQGVSISVEKKLPIGGGLGGGSSNAASTLLGLNQLWGLNLTLDELAETGVELGADVPVFVRGQNSLAEGVGEQLYPLELPVCWYLVVKPPINVATAAIFSHPQLTRDSLPIRIAAFFEGDQQDGLNSLYQTLAGVPKGPDSSTYCDDLPVLKNDCEALVCSVYPEVAEAIDWLNQYAKARMTGTGSCVFARFESEHEALNVLAKCPAIWRSFIARSSTCSSAHRALDRLKN